MDRTILHCDCNSFFASVECTSHPEYKNVPMAVCGNPEDRHGIVLAKNDIAKSYGIVTAETVWSARKKCPTLTVIPPHYDTYVEYYKKANEIYGRYTDLVEPFSIDESWLDVTGSRMLFGSGEKIAYEIKETVKKELGITISVGVSFNKIFAKMGSDYKKPDAVTVISRENFKSIVYPLPCSDLLFIGRSSAQTLSKCNIRTIGDIAAASPEFLEKKLGKSGRTMYMYAVGEDNSTVIPVSEMQDNKSIGRGLTFRRDITSPDDVMTAVRSLSDDVSSRLRRHGVKACGISLTIKDNFLSQITRQRRIKCPTDISSEISESAYALYRESWNPNRAIRMITVTAYGLVDADEVAEQITFFDDGNRREKSRKLEKTIDEIRERFGKKSIENGSVINNDIGIKTFDSRDKER